jgi:3-methylcrotonyl-CoA carboxylase alpha subunit
MRFTVTLGGETEVVEVVEHAGRYRVRLGEEWLDVDVRPEAAGPMSLLIDGVPWLADVDEVDGEVVVTLDGQPLRLQVEEAGGHGRRRRGAAGGAGQRLVAPMPGRVVAVHVRPGDRVEPDAPLVVLEAMKMENEFRAATGGVVAEVGVSPGQAVNAGDLLVVVAPDAA